MIKGIRSTRGTGGHANPEEIGIDVAIYLFNDESCNIISYNVLNVLEFTRIIRTYSRFAERIISYIYIRGKIRRGLDFYVSGIPKTEQRVRLPAAGYIPDE